MLLFENKKTDYVIIISKLATISENYAAMELAKYLYEISGADFQIHTDNRKYKKQIIIGNTAESLTTDMPKSDDGYIIKTFEDNLYINAKGTRGILYGVYSFLINYLGCRWFTLDCSNIPKIDRFEIQEIDEHFSPVLEYRDIAYGNIYNAEITEKLRLNGEYSFFDDKRGGKYRIIPFAHSLIEIFPVNQYYDEHPEYFPLVKGERIKSYSQICFTNKEAIQIALEFILQWKRENPMDKIFSVSMNDGYNWCECENCMSLNNQHQSLGASLYAFINEIAKRVKEEYPDIMIDTLAYLHTRKPPVGMILEDNIVIRYCNIETSIVNDFGTSSYMNLKNFDKSYSPETYFEELKDWRKLCKKLFVWDYPYNAAHHLLPIPNIYMFKRNLKKQLAIGIDGVFLNGNFLSDKASYAGLKSYIFANLLWDVNADIDSMINEFCDFYYGDASPVIKKAIAYIENRVNEVPFSMGIMCPPNEDYYNDEFADTLENLYKQAMALCQTQEQRDRVAVENLGVYVVRLAKMSSNDSRFEPMLNEFIANAKELKIQTFRDMAPDFDFQAKHYSNHLITKDWYDESWRETENL